MFPLPPNEAVVLAELARLLHAREVTEGDMGRGDVDPGGDMAAARAPATPSATSRQPTLFDNSREAA